jgi:hypothetical protein
MSIVIKGFVFHESFVKTYKGLGTIQARRKLKQYYTHSDQDAIIRYLKENGIIKH